MDKFISVHCNLYVMMTQCDDHVDDQLPNKLTRASFLLYAIECKDYFPKAAIVMVKGEKYPTGKTNKFEDAAAYLTPWYPVPKNHNTNRKLGTAEISDLSGGGSQIVETGAKQGRGSTGLEFRYYKYDGLKSFYKEICDEII